MDGAAANTMEIGDPQELAAEDGVKKLIEAVSAPSGVATGDGLADEFLVWSQSPLGVFEHHTCARGLGRPANNTWGKPL